MIKTHFDLAAALNIAYLGPIDEPGTETGTIQPYWDVTQFGLKAAPLAQTAKKPPSPMVDYLEKKKKGKQGGKRAGAGRPKGSRSVDPENLRLLVQIRLPRYLIDWMYTQDKSLTKTVESAVMQAMYRALSI